MLSETECQIMILGTRRSSQIQVKKKIFHEKKKKKLKSVTQIAIILGPFVASLKN